MIKVKNFISKVYEYYPQNIEGFNPSYNDTKEISQLIQKCEEFVIKEKNNWEALIDLLRTKLKEDITVIDKTQYFIKHPSLALQISNYKDNIHFNLYRSFIVPYFYISCLRLEGTIALQLKINPNKVFSLCIKDFILFLEADIFPEDYLNYKVPNVSFEDIKFNDFSLQNAFFNQKDLII